MSKALVHTQKQITALCKGAAKAGYVVEVKIGDVFVRLVPADDQKPKQPDRR